MCWCRQSEMVAWEEDWAGVVLGVAETEAVATDRRERQVVVHMAKEVQRV